MVKTDIFLFHGNFKILSMQSYISKWNTMWSFLWKRKFLLNSREIIFFLFCFEMELKSSSVLSCRAYTRVKRLATAVCLWHHSWIVKVVPPGLYFSCSVSLMIVCTTCFLLPIWSKINNDAVSKRKSAVSGCFFGLSWWGFLFLIIVLNLIIGRFLTHLKKIRREPEVFSVLH